MTHHEYDPIPAVSGRDQDPRTDTTLIGDYVAGDVDALAVLVCRYDRALHHAARRVLGNNADADDVVQSAWVSVARSASGFEYRCSVFSWLWRLAHNQALDHLRRQRARPQVPMFDGFDAAAAGDDFADTDDRVLVSDLLDQLTAAQREAIQLVHLQGHTVAEAAQMLGVAEGTIKSRCARARNALLRAATIR